MRDLLPPDITPERALEELAEYVRDSIQKRFRGKTRAQQALAILRNAFSQEFS